MVRQVYIAPNMNAKMVEEVLSMPSAFVRWCRIQREDGVQGYMDPTPAQMEVIQALEDAIRVPLESGSSGSRKELRFEHGGGITIESLEGRSPAVGRSIDRLHITEIGEAIHQREAIVSLFPGINKRKHAKLLLESTPGRAASYHEDMWLAANDPNKESRFFPLFLRWWVDDSCRSEIDGTFVPTEEELEYMGAHPGMTMEHVKFLRERLDSEFAGDTRLVSSKYPRGPFDGWLGSKKPRMPEEVLNTLLQTAQKDPTEGLYGCCEFEAPVEGETYEVIADPCGFGSTGDPAAITVFNMRTGDEVAVWADPEDPDKFAVRIEQVCARYNNAVAVVESNNTGCITALRNLRVRLTRSKNQPGWWATAQRIGKAEFELVRLLRAGQINIRSRAGLQQLRRYDGTFKRRETGSDGDVHHFDRARTYVMAAERLGKSLRRFDRMGAHEVDEEEQDPWPEGEIPVARLDKKRGTLQAANSNGWRMPRMR